ncbi:hypothetical protein BJ912DRAFT_1149662 [Pholiota molesta]|nr:hypothetical protein BJ912DRAFT_1149662 [Pholiota molesta]
MVLDSIKWMPVSNVSLELVSLLPNMRWTYTFFIAIHLLLQTVAHPISSVAPDKGAFELTRREPLPAVTRLQSKPKLNPVPPKLVQKKTQKKTQSTRRAGAKGSNIANVKAKALKTSTYRKTALKNANKSKNFSRLQADHILEAQTVSRYINGPIDEQCRGTLKNHLNAKENLDMLEANHNLHKGIVVTALNRGLNPKEPFHKPVKAYIQKHAVAIQKTAVKIDQEFRPLGKCAHIPVPHTDGVLQAAKHMIAHAKNV